MHFLSMYPSYSMGFSLTPAFHFLVLSKLSVCLIYLWQCQCLRRELGKAVLSLSIDRLPHATSVHDGEEWCTMVPCRVVDSSASSIHETTCHVHVSWSLYQTLSCWCQHQCAMSMCMSMCMSLSHPPAVLSQGELLCTWNQQSAGKESSCTRRAKEVRVPY